MITKKPAKALTLADFKVGDKVRFFPVQDKADGLDGSVRSWLQRHPDEVLTVCKIGERRVGCSLPEHYHDLAGVGHDCEGTCAHGNFFEVYNLQFADGKHQRKAKATRKHAPVHLKLTIEGLAVGSNTYDMSIDSTSILPVKLRNLGEYTYDGVREFVKTSLKNPQGGILANQYHRIELLRKYSKPILKLVDAIEAASKMKGKVIAG